MFKRLTILVFFLAIAAGIFGVIGHRQLNSWGTEKVTLASEQIVELKRGTSLKSFSTQLEKQGLVSSAFMFRLYVLLKRTYPKFQAGVYQFKGRVSPKAIQAKVIKGKIYEPVVLTITIPEAFTLKKIINRLVAAGVGTVDSLKFLSRDTSFLKSLGIKAQSMEGYIYPATYSFTSIPTEKEILTHMVETFFRKLPEDYEAEAAKVGLTLNEAITFASLIELETPVPEERPLISEVIWRRLKDRSPLGIDAALIYGIKDYDGDIRWKDLKDKNNPYNTRIHKGLPPTPIGSPSRASLAAVLSPASAGNYYFVAYADGTGRHHFSKTLAEHNRFVRKLVDATKEKRK